MAISRNEDNDAPASGCGRCQRTINRVWRNFRFGCLVNLRGGALFLGWFRTQDDGLCRAALRQGMGLSKAALVRVQAPACSD